MLNNLKKASATEGSLLFNDIISKYCSYKYDYERSMEKISKGDGWYNIFLSEACSNVFKHFDVEEPNMEYCSPEYLLLLLVEDKLQIPKESSYRYIVKGYNRKQLKQIADGLMLGIDVSKYANKDIGYKEMDYLKSRIQNGDDVSSFAYPYIDVEAMKELEELIKDYPQIKDYMSYIRCSGDIHICIECLEKSIDPIIHLNQKYELKVRRFLLDNWVNDINLYDYLCPDITRVEVEAWYKSWETGLDYAGTLQQGFTNEQIIFLTDMYVMGIDTDKFFYKNFTPKMLQFVIDEFKEGRVVDSFPTDLQPKHFDFVRDAYIANVDLTNYLNKNNLIEYIHIGELYKSNIDYILAMEQQGYDLSSYAQFIKKRKHIDFVNFCLEKDINPYQYLEDGTCDYILEYKDYFTDEFNLGELIHTYGFIMFRDILDVYAKIEYKDILYNKNFDVSIFTKIKHHLKKGKDISILYKDYSYVQVETILMWLKYDIDILEYCDNSYNSYQMNVIARGLKNGVNILSMCDSSTPVDTMENMVENLIELRGGNKITLSLDEDEVLWDDSYVDEFSSYFKQNK